MTTLDEKVIAIERALRAAGIPHAFGGAIALAYYGTPRGTVDVDVNLFVSEADVGRVLAVLAPLGVEAEEALARRQARRGGPVRVFWEHTPVDLFFAYDPLHEACAERRRRVPFPGGPISILSAEDLAVFKVLFARDKDWRDLEEMLFALGETFDTGYVTGWLECILVADDERLARFRSLRPAAIDPGSAPAHFE